MRRKRSARVRGVDRALAAWGKSLRAAPGTTPLMCLTLTDGKGLGILPAPGCSEEVAWRVFLALARTRMEGGR